MSAPRWVVSCAATLLLLAAASAEVSHTALRCSAPQEMTRFRVSLPNTAATQELFNACAANGGARWDHSAIVKALELMADHEIGDPAVTSPPKS